MSEVMHFESADAVLTFAIEREEEARDFYNLEKIWTAPDPSTDSMSAAPA